MLGAHIARRVNFAPGCRLERPWCVTIGECSTFEKDVWLKLVDDDARLSIGAFTFVGAGTEIDVIEQVSIGDHTLIAPGCFITDHGHGIAANSRIDQQPCAAEAVRIGSDVWLGAGAVVLPSVEIGDGAVIGAHAVVTRDVAPYEIVAGVPARVIGRRT